jgi:uncharacterized protein (DUF1330 family)
VSAYVISEVEVLDQTLADEYRSLSEASIVEYGGRYIVRDAVPDAVEGSWDGRRRLVVVEFPSMQVAREWYSSPSYSSARMITPTALARRLLFVEGL